MRVGVHLCTLAHVGKLHLQGLHYAQYRHPFEGLLSYVFCLHVCVCNVHRPEEGVRSPGTGVTDVCE